MERFRHVWRLSLPIIRAVTNFSSKRGIVKSIQGIKKVSCYSRRLRLGGGGDTVEVKGLGKYKNWRWPIFTMEQLGVVAANLAPSFSLNFLSIFGHI